MMLLDVLPALFLTHVGHVANVRKQPASLRSDPGPHHRNRRPTSPEYAQCSPSCQHTVGFNRAIRISNHVRGSTQGRQPPDGDETRLQLDALQPQALYLFTNLVQQLGCPGTHNRQLAVAGVGLHPRHARRPSRSWTACLPSTARRSLVRNAQRITCAAVCDAGLGQNPAAVGCGQRRQLHAEVLASISHRPIVYLGESEARK